MEANPLLRQPLLDEATPLKVAAARDESADDPAQRVPPRWARATPVWGSLLLVASTWLAFLLPAWEPSLVRALGLPRDRVTVTLALQLAAAVNTGVFGGAALAGAAPPNTPVLTCLLYTSPSPRD